jgi:hypothetical protein
MGPPRKSGVQAAPAATDVCSRRGQVAGVAERADDDLYQNDFSRQGRIDRLDMVPSAGRSGRAD